MASLKFIHRSLKVVASIALLLLFAGSMRYASDLSDIAPSPKHARMVASGNPPGELHILTYNVLLRPSVLSSADYTLERAQQIGKWLKHGNVDIVALQEAWDSQAVSILVEEVRHDLPYYIVNQPTEQPVRSISGGLTILSRWPIEEMRTLVYDNCSGFDCRASKGAVHVVIRLSANSYLNFVTTHLDAGEIFLDRKARALQLEQLHEFMAEIDEDLGPVVVAADFNIDSLAGNGEYEELVDTLGVEGYEVSNISTLNCGLTSVFCEETTDPKRLDYVFTLSGEQRLRRKETRHLPLATDSIDKHVRYLSDHCAVWVVFETNF
ncbi:MAG: sphingomyelin phosphodiesterase [Anaerolineae bacterium]